MEVAAGIGVGLWSGCSEIGLERWVSAFFVKEGLDPDKWSEVFRKIGGELPDEENEQCSTAKYCVEYPSIGSHSLECYQTRGGLGGGRHFRHKRKPKLTIIAGVVIVDMVTRPFLYFTGMRFNHTRLSR